MRFHKSDFISLCKSIIELDSTNILKDITCPTLVIYGKNYKANKATSIQLQKLMPNAELKIISNAGHKVNIDNPFAYGNEIKDFFNNY